jgi:GNAT superfamily N-acetyltransferase
MITIRDARPEDADTLLTLIDALADYEKLERPTAEARARLTHDAFERTPVRFYAVIAEHDGKPVAYSLFFETYSSFLAKPTLYLEDLFVLPDARRFGVGDAIFRYLAGEALRRGCGRMEWACLDWNQLAIGFYEKRGAQHLDDWRSYRLTEPGLQAVVAASESKTS